MAEVTFQSVVAPLGGRTQTKQAYADEIHNFRRTLLYAGPPYSTRWYDVAASSADAGARLFILVRRRDGVSTRRFRRYLNTELVPALASGGVLTELRTQVFMKWNRALWNSRTSPTTTRMSTGSTRRSSWGSRTTPHGTRTCAGSQTWSVRGSALMPPQSTPTT